MLDEKTAMELWEQRCGKAVEAHDREGRLVVKTAYGQTDSDFGWVVNHRIPIHEGGTEAFSNLDIVHVAALKGKDKK